MIPIRVESAMRWARDPMRRVDDVAEHATVAKLAVTGIEPVDSGSEPASLGGGSRRFGHFRISIFRVSTPRLVTRR
jgi:hypothetical protein